MNRLQNEQSPYLLMHADNPVNWFAWSEEAFEKARKENKPMFLSIGYSTCHWCHVMEAESFKDPNVARLLNETFIPVKVDREERPDIDSIYMTVCIMFTGSGGWPLTILMTPEKEPFYAATYIPKYSHYGRPGLIDLIPIIKTAWERDQDEIVTKAKENVLAVKLMQKGESGHSKISEDVIHRLYTELSENFDPENGGFGTKPKFPSVSNLFFLLRYWYITKKNDALSMVEKQLREMHLGGIYDHIGFGFHRYSTDMEWKVPHFEKMLYDQALLALVYTEAFQATGKELYKSITIDICTYVLNNLQAKNGGFYSAEDADSEGVEGKYYLWSLDELRSILTEDELALFLKIYPVRAEGNFEEESTGRMNGLNIIYREKGIGEIAQSVKQPVSEVLTKLGTIRVRLEQERKKRVPPLKDTKILTDWNGLMIAVLAKAARVFNIPHYADAAARAVTFIMTTMMDDKKGLLHRYRNNVKGIDAFADDYAFLTWGLIELYETTFSPFYLEKSIELTDYFISHFWEKETGGFYMSAHNNDELIVRKKEYADQSLPAANSIALFNLTRLSRITGKDLYKIYTHAITKNAAYAIERVPQAYAFHLGVFLFSEHPDVDIIIVGEKDSPDTELLLTSLRSVYIPGKIVILKTPDNTKRIEKILPFLHHYKKIHSKATAYVCRSFACKLPTNEPVEMLTQLMSEISSHTG